MPGLCFLQVGSWIQRFGQTRVHFFMVHSYSFSLVLILSVIFEIGIYSCDSTMNKGDFPGGPVVRTPRFHCRGPGSIPGRGTEILGAA